ncbi:MAG: flagellar basal body L-ring protein FlgH [Gemmatimonadaceae bacterium]
MNLRTASSFGAAVTGTFIAALVLSAAPLRAQDTTAAPRRAWTSDRLHLAVGDIVTVLIDERTLASANLRDQDVNRRRRELDAGINSPGGTSTAAGMGSGQDADSRRSGEAVRQNAFRTEMSARVVAISPSGMLQLQGSKRVQLDKNIQTVSITGWVRPHDIAIATNTVESSRLADAAISYAQEGTLGKPRSGIITRVLGAIWP